MGGTHRVRRVVRPALVWQALGLVDTDDPQPPHPAPTGVDEGPSVPSAGLPRAPRARWHPLWFVLGAALALVAALVGAAGVVRAPYVVFAPGNAFDTEAAIVTPGTESYPSDGEVLFLTVSLRGATRQVGYVEAGWGWIRGDQDVAPREAIVGNQTGAQNREQSLQMMTSSQEVAAKVALEHLGYDVASEGTGVVVLSTIEEAPVAALVDPGDVIVGLDGERIDLDSQLRAALADARPGQEVTLSVEKGSEGEPEDVTTELIADPGGEGRAVLGIGVGTRDLRYDLPFPVRIDTEDVGGPSAGLALTLGILDHLTPGSLTGGANVATTGTIEANGTIGEVGGVAQKAIAAKRAGATLLLVPEAEVADAKRTASDGLEVVGVATLDDALDALAAIGGNALELDRTGG